MAELGRAYIDVHADMDPFAREVPAGARKTTESVNTDFERVGHEWGDTLAEETAKEFGKHGGSFQRAFDDIARVTHLPDGFFIDRNGRVRDSWGRFAKNFGEDIAQDVENAFQEVAKPGGPLDTFGKAISDAVGSAFNISGKSPLISLLIIVFGALAGVIGAAVQAINAFIAVAATLPALLTSIGLQVGVLMLAFDGMQKSIQKAFKATNAEELQAAIENLTPAAQQFVKSLLPLRDMFNNLKAVVQQNFFSAFGDTLTRIAKALGPTFFSGFAMLATSMGNLFRQLGLFFASPEFVNFIRDVFPATARWLASFGPGFVSLLKALIGMADRTIPFLERIGMIVGNALNSFVDWLNGQVQSGAFGEWLDRMGHTLDLVAKLFFQASEFVAAFFDALDKAGGNDLITTLGDSLEMLAAVLTSASGQEAIRSLIQSLVLMMQVFTGLVISIISVIAFFNFLKDAIDEFFKFLTQVVDPAVNNFFLHTIPDAVSNAWNAIVGFFDNLWMKVRMAFASFIQSAQDWFNGVIDWIEGLPGRILNALGDLGSLLWAKGRALVQGFLDGILSLWNEIRQTAANLAHTIAGFLPGSPAEEGPLSGKGYVKLRGQRMVQDFIAGIESQDSSLKQTSSDSMSQVVNFGGIRMEFGGIPTEQQARTAGEAVGAGITNQMTDRDVSLAVRMM